MDQASLKNSDVLILTGLTQIPTANPDSMVGEFCSNLGMYPMQILNKIKCFTFIFWYLDSVVFFVPLLHIHTL